MVPGVEIGIWRGTLVARWWGVTNKSMVQSDGCSYTMSETIAAFMGTLLPAEAPMMCANWFSSEQRSPRVNALVTLAGVH